MSHPSPVAAAAARHNAARTQRRRRVTWPWIVGAGVGWMALLLVSAWQGDDAFITHRSAANLVAGHGAVWNVGERVQSYTHPLWFGLSVWCHAMFDEGYVSVLLVSVVLMLLTVAGIGLGVARDRRAGAQVVLALSLSGAVVDYGVSGLENPLLALLLVGGLAACARLPMPRDIGLAGLFVSAVGLTRMDALLLAGPPLLAMAHGLRPRRRALLPLLLAAVPFVCWELFSLVYYGALVPNTALAKLNLAIPRGELITQGARYLAWSAAHDPLTLALLVAGGWSGWRRGGRIERSAVGGVGLYLAYVVWIGGDFMGGRFLMAPTVVCAALLARTWRLPSDRRAWLLAAALLAYGLVWPESRWMAGPNHGVGVGMSAVVAPSGVADERAYYQPTTGLVRNLRAWTQLRGAGLPIPPYPGARAGLEASAQGQAVRVADEVGFFGYFAGPRVHVVDAWALGDPLLARLPFEPTTSWRIGHYPRAIPPGYLETLRTGRNQLEDPALRTFYDDIHLATRAPLTAPGRWAAIWRLNVGGRSRR